MDKKNGLFENYSSPEYRLGEDFEDSVFRKIKSRKRRRKVAVSTFGLFILGAMIFIGGSSIVTRKNMQPRFAGIQKGDVMLTDDVVFAAFDGQNSYIIENIGPNRDDISI